MTGAPGTTLRDDVAAAAGSRALWGAFVSSDSPHVAEIMGRSGFDWLVVDTQHAPASGSGNLASMIAAAGIVGSRVLVRIPWKTDFAAAMWALDAGADGVLAPMVDSAEEAAGIAGACRYPPEGFRSFGPWRVSQQYPSYNTDIGDRRALCLVQIETRGGLNSLEAILAVPGIDGVYIGPQDLSISHGAGLSWRTDNEVLHEMAERILAAAHLAGKVAVAHTADIGDALHWAGLGFDMVTATSDFRLLTVGARESVTTLRGGSAAQESERSPTVDRASGSDNERVAYP
jgi:4-hydroxy-2-oxoheptanedioate aldolase